MRSSLQRHKRQRAMRGLVVEALESRLVPAVFVVNTTLELADTNPGDGVVETGFLVGVEPAVSLLAAIQEANAHPNDPGQIDEIHFHLPDNDKVFQFLGALPNIVDPVYINGFSQPGSQANTQTNSDDSVRGVTIDGSVAAGLVGAPVNGLVFAAGSQGSYVEGIELTNFLNGVVVSSNNVSVGGMRITNSDANGILVQTGVAGTTLGGSLVGSRNVIGSSKQAGIQVNGNTTTVQNNWLGLNPDSSPSPNGVGIQITGTKTNVVANRIEFNGIGVSVEGTARAATILSNVIVNNSGLGIDLVRNPGVTPNDPLDSDDGPNGLQNFPDLVSVRREFDGLGNIVTIIDGMLSAPSPAPFYRLEFFAVGMADASGHGEGDRLIGTLDLNSAGGGVLPFQVVLPIDLFSIRFVSATATDLSTGSTSEFSKVAVVQDLIGPPDGSPPMGSGTTTTTPTDTTPPTVDPPTTTTTTSAPGDPNQPVAIVLASSFPTPGDVGNIGPHTPAVAGGSITTTFAPPSGILSASAGVGGSEDELRFASDSYFEQFSRLREYVDGGIVVGSPGLTPGQLGRARGPGSPITGNEPILPFDRSQNLINESQINEADENPERWRSWINEIPLKSDVGAKPMLNGSSCLPTEAEQPLRTPDPSDRVTLAEWLPPVGLFLLLPWFRRKERERGTP